MSMRNGQGQPEVRFRVERKGKESKREHERMESLDVCFWLMNKKWE